MRNLYFIVVITREFDGTIGAAISVSDEKGDRIQLEFAPSTSEQPVEPIFIIIQKSMCRDIESLSRNLKFLLLDSTCVQSVNKVGNSSNVALLFGQFNRKCIKHFNMQKFAQVVKGLLLLACAFNRFE